MTRDEVKDLMAVLRAGWPQFCRGMTAEHLRRLVDIWANALDGYEEQLAKKAVDELMRTQKYAPGLAEVLQAVRREKAREDDFMLNYTTESYGFGAQSGMP